MSKFQKYFTQNKISTNAVGIYLLTLLSVMFLTPFYVNTKFDSFITNTTYVLNVASSMYIIIKVSGKKIFAFAGVGIIVLFILDYIFFIDTLDFLSKIFFAIFSIIALVCIYISISRISKIQRALSIDMIYAAVAGYVYIGILGYILLQFLYSIDSSSLISNTGAYLNTFDIKYFSFVTLTTLGYGDISPVSDKAKALSCFNRFNWPIIFNNCNGDDCKRILI